MGTIAYSVGAGRNLKPTLCISSVTLHLYRLSLSQKQPATSELWEPICLSLQHWAYMDTALHLAFVIVSGDLKLGPQACSADTLLTELSPQLPFYFLRENTH